jgi:hypothetical protein
VQNNNRAMKIETISRGPQFKGIISTLGLIIFPFVLLFGIFAFAKVSFLAGIVSLLISAAAFFLFLDVRGVQIDLEKKLIRNYRQYIIWKFGEWFPMEKYNSIHLAKDTFYVRNMVPGIGLMGGSSGATKISTFDVALVCDFAEDYVLLSEFESHGEATAFLHDYAVKLSLPSRDIYRELQASAVSRRATTRRR